MAMVRHGVATWKGTAMTEERWGTRCSRSTGRPLCLALAVRVQAWKARPFGRHAYPLVIVDALVVQGRRDQAVRATRALIVSGGHADGQRARRGLRLGERESEGTLQCPRTFYTDLNSLICELWPQAHLPYCPHTGRRVYPVIAWHAPHGLHERQRQEDQLHHGDLNILLPS
jgi:transposase-like protein